MLLSIAYVFKILLHTVKDCSYIAWPKNGA